MKQSLAEFRYLKREEQELSLTLSATYDDPHQTNRWKNEVHPC